MISVYVSTKDSNSALVVLAWLFLTHFIEVLQNFEFMVASRSTQREEPRRQTRTIVYNVRNRRASRSRK